MEGKVIKIPKDSTADIENTLLDINSKLTTLGQKHNVDSMPVTLSVEQEEILKALSTSQDMVGIKSCLVSLVEQQMITNELLKEILG